MVFNDQPSGIYIYGGIRTYVSNTLAYERLLLDKNVS